MGLQLEGSISAAKFSIFFCETGKFYSTQEISLTIYVIFSPTKESSKIRS